MLSLIKLIGRALFRLLFSVEYHGLENVPETGPVIIAGNHPSYLDPALVGLPVKRTIKFMAWDALFKVPLLGQVIRAMGAFPVDIRRGKGEAAYREALRVLESGYALGIFPEGQRSERGPMGELRTGTARLAIETGAPIVPVTIGGAFRAWPKWRLLPKPASIVVRYHEPVRLDEAERAARRDDREFANEVMQKVAERINRSLIPSLRGSQSLERWYSRPPSHVRSYEWAPLIAAIVASVIAGVSQTLSAYWINVWLPVAGYYLYLIADLSLIKPSRTVKWLRNSMPVWLILIWHYPLTESISVQAGAMNELLAGAVVVAFFPFFWEDYYTLQRFVRGLVVVYYFSLALLLNWPEPLGTLTATLCFIIAFTLWYRTIYYPAIVAAMVLSLAAALWRAGAISQALAVYVLLAIAALIYLQTFINVAYDIRKAGDVSAQSSAEHPSDSAAV
ncbi:MAG: 1-acyl-sn-glycerol-3-phosphate acyltransferase [Blastocatellia bacterium]|nr:1-acyl-sn-glycerol-3-phosphate acyltransferase [Blastocatellia bacterium]